MTGESHMERSMDKPARDISVPVIDLSLLFLSPGILQNEIVHLSPRLSHPMFSSLVEFCLAINVAKPVQKSIGF